MNYTKIVYKNSYYCLSDSNTYSLELLVLFFEHDFSDASRKSLRDMIATTDSDVASGNLICIDWNNSNVTITDIFEYHNELTSNNSLTITKANFFTVLDRWAVVIKQQPDEIIITQDDNGVITITGKFADGREI